MKLNVPFHKSIKDTDCGPLALKMVLEYFGEKHSFEELAELERTIDAGLVWSLGIARAAKRLGFNVKFISSSNFSLEDDIDYYKKYANDKAKIILKELNDELKKLNVKIEEKQMKLDELLGFVTKNSIPIVLVNWFVLSGKQGYNGHFVPVTGFDEKNVYVHNPGLADAVPHFSIKREIFLKAWESKGTDKDTIIIYRK